MRSHLEKRFGATEEGESLGQQEKNFEHYRTNHNLQQLAIGSRSHQRSDHADRRQSVAGGGKGVMHLVYPISSFQLLWYRNPK
jgi:hypothetical protein